MKSLDEEAMEAQGRQEAIALAELSGFQRAEADLEALKKAITPKTCEECTSLLRPQGESQRCLRLASLIHIRVRDNAASAIGWFEPPPNFSCSLFQRRPEKPTDSAAAAKVA